MARTFNPKLTAPMMELLKELVSYIDVNGRPPIYSELTKKLNVSMGTIQGRVRELIDRGYITKGYGLRSIKILRRPEEPPEGSIVAVPLIGTVIAGKPCLAQENIEGEILIDSSIVGNGSCFAVRTWGESMINVGIKNGDILIVRRQCLAENGDIVIATLNGDTTVKKLHYENRNIYLVPENDEMPSIPVGPDDELMIHGVVLCWRSVAA